MNYLLFLGKEVDIKTHKYTRTVEDDGPLVLAPVEALQAHNYVNIYFWWSLFCFF